MQNIEYQLFMDYAKGLCMAIPNGFDALFGGVSMRVHYIAIIYYCVA